MKNNDRIDNALADVVRIAREYAKENMGAAVEPSHLFKALLHKEAGLVSFIEKTLAQDYYYLLDWADMRVRMEHKGSRPEAELQLSPASVEVIEEAESIAEKIGADDVDARILLASVVTPGVGFSHDQLKTLPLTPDDVLNAIGPGPSKGVKSHDKPAKAADGAGKSNVGKFCHDLNAQVHNGDVDPVIGFL